MDNFLNYETRILQNALTINLNESKLPIEIKRIILEGLLNKVTLKADQIVKDEEILIQTKKSETSETE